jgi:precorrin-6B methylase 2
VIDIVPGFEDMVIYEDAKCAFKGDTLLELAKKYDLHVFVETGTYAGEMIKYVNARHTWYRIYSIELSERLAKRAMKLFEAVENVVIWQGSSDEILKGSLFGHPTLFWLDAHACGGVTARGKKITPILEELETVVNDVDHVIVIDDLDNLPKWGVTLQALQEFIKARKPSMNFEIIDTMLICTPTKTGILFLDLMVKYGILKDSV